MGLISIIEASRRLGVTQQTLRNWVADGHIEFKTVGKARYINEKIIDGLMGTVKDLEDSKRRLERLIEQNREEIRWREEVRLKERTMRHYLNFMVGAASRSRFFEAVVNLMVYCDMLTTREGNILVSFLYGERLEVVADEYGLTRERIRQIVEKAVRKSADLTTIKSKLTEIENLQVENNYLKSTIIALKKNLKEDDEYANKLVDKHLCQLLSKNLLDCGLSVRAINTVQALTDSYQVTVGDLCRLKRLSIITVRNAGRKTLSELDEFLETNNLSWDMDVDAIYSGTVKEES